MAFVGLSLVLAVAGATAAGPQSRPADTTANVAVERPDYLAGDRSLQVEAGPPRGIRTYGKGAVLLTTGTSASVALGEPGTSETPSSGREVEVTNKISGVPMAGSVRAFTVSPDGTRAVYIADQETAGRFELYSVPVDGSVTPTKISAGLTLDPGEEGVSAFQITPDGTTVVFLADPNAAGVDELFSVPIDSSTPLASLNVTAARPVTGFGITADSAYAVFLGVDSTFGSGAVELYAASVGVAQSSRQISDVGQGNVNGDVIFADLSPDSARAIYAADAVSDEVFQWFSVPIVGSGVGSDVQISAALGSVGVAAISPNSATIVYASDDSTAGVLDVYAKPIAGGSKIQLNPSMAGSGVTFVAISPDGSRVGYLADQNTAGVPEVYSALIGVAGSGTRLNTPMSGTQTADTLNIAPDSSRVLYEADQDTPGTFELFGAPIAGGTPSTLDGMTAPDDVGYFTGLGTPIIARRAVYPVFGTAVNLYGVPYDGSGSSTRINGALSTGNTVFNAFLPSVATRLMAYGTGPSADAITTKAYSVPVRADLPAEQINATAATNTLGVQGYEITSDQRYAVYLQDQDTAGKPELFSHVLDSDGDTVANHSDNCPFAANTSQGSVVLSQTITATSKTTFAWSPAAEVRYVRGPLNMVSTYATDASGTLVDAASLSDTTAPAAGNGLYYLFAPDCSARSYQSALGSEPGRDLASFP